MPFKDLREYLSTLEKLNMLVRVKKKITDPHEIFTIVWELNDRGGDPAVIFENVMDYGIPVVSNIFGSEPKRWGLAISLPMDLSVRELRNHYIKILDDKSMWKKPVIVEKSSAPCKEVILKGDDINLYKFPILQWHPLDGGAFITLGLSITKDPEFGRNVGIYRMKVLDKDKTTLLCSPHQHIGIMLDKARKAGKKSVECAVAIGTDPALLVAGWTKLRIREDEFEFAAALRGGQPIELVKCETVDLEVPATAEIVLEGEISTEEIVPEGTFGEWMGYHEEQAEAPVFKIKCITHRKDPLYVTTIVSHPRADGEAFFRSVSQNAHFYRQVRDARVPGFVDAWLPLSGHGFMGIVSIKKIYPGWGRQVIYQLFGIPFVAATMNVVIVVDDDIDPSNLEQVIWALSTRVDPKRDVVIIDPLAMYGLNPAASKRIKIPGSTGEITICSRMGIDATLKTREDLYERPTPIPVRPQPEMLKKVREQWSEYGFK
jgi:4-hydroxy-3-polyprenylbenzoate decarboxylase